MSNAARMAHKCSLQQQNHHDPLLCSSTLSIVSIVYLSIYIYKYIYIYLYIYRYIYTNFNVLCQKIKEDMWSLIPVLGFESQIESVKMNILAQVLYLFQTVPVEITDNQFNKWD